MFNMYMNLLEYMYTILQQWARTRQDRHSLLGIRGSAEVCQMPNWGIHHW